MDERHLRISSGAYVVLRPGLPTAHLARCIDALMTIADHDPNCPKSARDCVDMIRMVADQVLAEVLEAKSERGHEL